jgi:hypothetical protein
MAGRKRSEDRIRGGTAAGACYTADPDKTSWSVETMGTQESDPRKDIAARLEKAIVELKELEAAIKFIGPNINTLLLTDFRDATDHIRVTAWTMQSWLEQHGKEGSEYPFLPMLTQERVRRATQLCEDLAADLEAMELTRETEGIEKFEKLHRAVGRLSRPLEPLFRE